MGSQVCLCDVIRGTMIWGAVHAWHPVPSSSDGDSAHLPHPGKHTLDEWFILRVKHNLCFFKLPCSNLWIQHNKSSALMHNGIHCCCKMMESSNWKRDPELWKLLKASQCAFQPWCDHSTQFEQCHKTSFSSWEMTENQFQDLLNGGKSCWPKTANLVRWQRVAWKSQKASRKPPTDGRDLSFQHNVNMINMHWHHCLMPRSDDLKLY